jgi:hypothetical protein
MRVGIAGVRPTAGRVAVVSAVVALLASAAGFSAQPAAAGLVSGFSNPERAVLQTDVTVRADDPEDVGRAVLTVPVTLQAGQTRRISDQLAVTVTRDTEVENFVECLDPAGDPDLGVNAGGQPQAHDSGTNYSSGMGQLSMHGSLLFTAPHTGTFLCQVRAHTDAGTLTAVMAPWPGGTWLEIDNFTSDAPLWWQIDTCNSTGSDPHCIYLGVPPGHQDHHPVTTTLFEHLGWIAAPDASMAGVVAHMQLTSCYAGTASCPEREWGDDSDDPGYAKFRTHLDFIQLDPRNGPCQVTSTPDTEYTIGDDVHHFLVDYAPPTVMISPTCGGSRRFLLHVVVTWTGGNPVKIDSGSVSSFRSATNANVIVRRSIPATTVPPVIGVDEGSVAGHLAGSGLTVGRVTRVAYPVRAGTVIAQNSPAGTMEPIGSPVNLIISLGPAVVVTVPDLEGDTTAQATRALAAVGLVSRITQSAQCTDPGHVIGQVPGAGTSVAPGATVTITVDSGTYGIICR